MMVEAGSITIGGLSNVSVVAGVPLVVVAGNSASAKTCSSVSESNAPAGLCVAPSTNPGSVFMLLAVLQTMLSSARAVPQTLLPSAGAVAQTMLSAGSEGPPAALAWGPACTP